MLAKLTPCRKMSVESTPDHHYSDVRLRGTKSKQFFSVEERESSISPELFTTAFFFSTQAIFELQQCSPWIQVLNPTLHPFVLQMHYQKYQCNVTTGDKILP